MFDTSQMVSQNSKLEGRDLAEHRSLQLRSELDELRTAQLLEEAEAAEETQRLEDMESRSKHRLTRDFTMVVP